jgi:hypothetical protein
MRGNQGIARDSGPEIGSSHEGSFLDHCDVTRYCPDVWANDSEEPISSIKNIINPWTRFRMGPGIARNSRSAGGPQTRQLTSVDEDQVWGPRVSFASQSGMGDSWKPHKKPPRTGWASMSHQTAIAR